MKFLNWLGLKLDNLAGDLSQAEMLLSYIVTAAGIIVALTANGSQPHLVAGLVLAGASQAAAQLPKLLSDSHSVGSAALAAAKIDADSRESRMDRWAQIVEVMQKSLEPLISAHLSSQAETDLASFSKWVCSSCGNVNMAAPVAEGVEKFVGVCAKCLGHFTLERDSAPLSQVSNPPPAAAETPAVAPAADTDAAAAPATITEPPA